MRPPVAARCRELIEALRAIPAIDLLCSLSVVGCYADNESAAVSCTGHGESIMKIVMAKAAADLVASGQYAQAAADAAVTSQAAQPSPRPHALAPLHRTVAGSWRLCPARVCKPW